MTLNRQQKSAELVKAHFNQCTMPRNQVAARSGLSNPYIKDLESGHYKNVDRNKLISLSIGLGLSLKETDRLLNVFDRTDLTIEDIPLYTRLGSRPISSSAMIPMRGGYQYELALLSTESIDGDLYITSAQPTSALCSKGHRWHSNADSENMHPLYADLIDAINHERNRIMLKNLKKNRVEHFVCEDCLKQYLENLKDTKEKRFRYHHIENLIEHIEANENFYFRLIDPCSRAHFTYKKTSKRSKIPDTVLFYFWPFQREVDFRINHSQHIATEAYEARFNGFTTTNPFVMSSFDKELEVIQQSVIEKYMEKEKIIEYLKSVIS